MRCTAAIALLLLLSACQREKTFGPDEVRSQLKTAASEAAEVSTFLTYVRQGRALATYAHGYAEDLRHDIDQQIEEIAHARPEPRYLQPLDRCRLDLVALRGEVDRIGPALGRTEELGKIAVSVDKIRADLNVEVTRP